MFYKFFLYRAGLLAFHKYLRCPGIGVASSCFILELVCKPYELYLGATLEEVRSNC